MTGPQDSVQMMLAEHTMRREFVLEWLRSIPGVKCTEPGGAFYADPNISVSLARAGLNSAFDVPVKLLDKSPVAGVPGEAFGTKDPVRITYATSMALLGNGLGRIAACMSSL